MNNRKIEKLNKTAIRLYKKLKKTHNKRELETLLRRYTLTIVELTLEIRNTPILVSGFYQFNSIDKKELAKESIYLRRM